MIPQHVAVFADHDLIGFPYQVDEREAFVVLDTKTRRAGLVGKSQEDIDAIPQAFIDTRVPLLHFATEAAPAGDYTATVYGGVQWLSTSGNGTWVR